jgi:hypothetical protein
MLGNNVKEQCYILFLHGTPCLLDMRATPLVVHARNRIIYTVRKNFLSKIGNMIACISPIQSVGNSELASQCRLTAVNHPVRQFLHAQPPLQKPEE